MITRSCFKQSKEPLRACNHAFNSSYFLLSIPSASRRLLVVSIKLTGTRKLFFVFCRQLSIQHYNRCGQIICMAKYTRGVWNAMAGVGMQLPCKYTMNTIKHGWLLYEGSEVLNGIHRALAYQHLPSHSRLGNKKYTQLTRLTFVESGAKTNIIIILK